jgi:ubiquitin-conjugating enzyme E2 variant
MSTEIWTPKAGETRKRSGWPRYVSTPGRPWWLPFLEGSGVGLWLFFWCSYLYRLMQSVSIGWFSACFAVLLGVLASDFMSGFLHWLFDTFFEITTPVIGPHLVGPFREHHRDPLAMTRHHLLESAGNSCLAWLPAMALVWWFGPWPGAATFGGVFFYWFVASFAFFLTASNQFHSWAHDAKMKGWVRRIQALGLLVSPEHHAPHHVAPHRVRYCTTTGWVNYVTDRFGVFEYLEKVFVALGFPCKSRGSD